MVHVWIMYLSYILMKVVMSALVPPIASLLKTTFTDPDINDDNSRNFKLPLGIIIVILLKIAVAVLGAIWLIYRWATPLLASSLLPPSHTQPSEKDAHMSNAASLPPPFFLNILLSFKKGNFSINWRKYCRIIEYLN